MAKIDLTNKSISNIGFNLANATVVSGSATQTTRQTNYSKQVDIVRVAEPTTFSIPFDGDTSADNNYYIKLDKVSPDGKIVRTALSNKNPSSNESITANLNAEDSNLNFTLTPGDYTTAGEVAVILGHGIYYTTGASKDNYITFSTSTTDKRKDNADDDKDELGIVDSCGNRTLQLNNFLIQRNRIQGNTLLGLVPATNSDYHNEAANRSHSRPEGAADQTFNVRADQWGFTYNIKELFDNLYTTNTVGRVVPMYGNTNLQNQTVTLPPLSNDKDFGLIIVQEPAIFSTSDYGISPATATVKVFPSLTTYTNDIQVLTGTTLKCTNNIYYRRFNLTNQAQTRYVNDLYQSSDFYPVNPNLAEGQAIAALMKNITITSLSVDFNFINNIQMKDERGNVTNWEKTNTSPIHVVFNNILSTDNNTPFLQRSSDSLSDTSADYALYWAMRQQSTFETLPGLLYGIIAPWGVAELTGDDRDAGKQINFVQWDSKRLAAGIPTYWDDTIKYINDAAHFNSIHQIYNTLSFNKPMPKTLYKPDGTFNRRWMTSFEDTNSLNYSRVKIFIFKAQIV